MKNVGFGAPCVGMLLVNLSGTETVMNNDMTTNQYPNENAYGRVLPHRYLSKKPGIERLRNQIKYSGILKGFSKTLELDRIWSDGAPGAGI